MKRVSIQDLKARLSAAVAEAESGQTIVITRHNRDVARMTPASDSNTHQIVSSGLRPLKPLLRRATKGRYLDVLRDDRSGER